MNPAFHTILSGQPAQAGKDIAQQASTSGLPHITSRAPFPLAGLRQPGALPRGAGWPPCVATGDESHLSYRHPADSMNRAFHTLFRDQPAHEVSQDIALQVTSAAHESSQTANDICQSAATGAEDTQAQSRQCLHMHPLPPVLGAFTLGLALGCLLELTRHQERTPRKRFGW